MSKISISKLKQIQPVTSFGRLNRKSNELRVAFQDDALHATCLIVLCYDLYGMEFLQWHPETLMQELERDVDRDLSPYTFNRLMSAISIINTDLFYSDLRGFISTADTLSGNFDSLADPQECAWSIAQAYLLDPDPMDEKGPEAFHVDIRYYIGKMLDYTGIQWTPHSLTMAIRESDGPAMMEDLAFDPIAQPALEAEIMDADGIDNFVGESLKELVDQVQRLPISTGSGTKVAEEIARLSSAYFNALKKGAS